MQQISRLFLWIAVIKSALLVTSKISSISKLTRKEAHHRQTFTPKWSNVVWTLIHTGLRKNRFWGYVFQYKRLELQLTEKKILFNVHNDTEIVLFFSSYQMKHRGDFPIELKLYCTSSETSDTKKCFFFSLSKTVFVWIFTFVGYRALSLR